MAHPFRLTIGGVTWNAGANSNLLDIAGAAGNPTYPYVEPAALKLTQDASGSGASMSFTVTQPSTPSGVPWTLAMDDNAAVRFFDDNVSATDPVFRGFVQSTSVTLLPNGLGTETEVTVADPTAWLERTLVYRGGAASQYDQRNVGPITYSGKTDRQIITALLTLVGARQDAATKAIFDATLGADFYGSASASLGKVEIAPGTLRSALDTVAEEAQGLNGVVRRYFVDERGKLVYGTVRTLATTYPTATEAAPFEIVTDPGAELFSGTGAAWKTTARDIKVDYDHDRLLKRILAQAASFNSRYDTNYANTAYLRTYNLASPQGPGALTARGGPRAEAIIEMPTAKATNRTTRGKVVDDLSAAVFYGRARSGPPRSISVTIRGAIAGGANEYGLVSGYARTGASTWTLINRWKAGQWVSITAPGLGLTPAAYYRIESLSMGFEDRSFQRYYELTIDQPRRQGISGLRVSEG
jgi:hypothetical protein